MRKKIIKIEGNTKKKVAFAQKQFLESAIHNNALASNSSHSRCFDIEKEKDKSTVAMTALEVSSSLQAMLASQILSINKLQHACMIMANNLPYGEQHKYYTNSAIKLANTFIQQANLLAKLQGGCKQNISIEHLDVHQGGQAVVGTIQSRLEKK